MPDARAADRDGELALPPDAPSAGTSAPPSAAAGLDRRGAKLRLGTGLLALAAALVVSWGVTLPEIPLCAFKGFTGRPCPGCGMTRSVVHLLHGDVVASLRFHPLGIVMVGALVVGTAGAFAGAIGRRDRVWEWFDVKGAMAAIGFAVALVLLWVVRAFVVPEWSPDPIGTAGFPWFPK